MTFQNYKRLVFSEDGNVLTCPSSGHLAQIAT
jgi:hypothetical protein